MPVKQVHADWEMTVKVKLRGAYDHADPHAEQMLRSVIADEGGAMQVICGWCNSDDLEIVELRPVHS